MKRRVSTAATIGLLLVSILRAQESEVAEVYEVKWRTAHEITEILNGFGIIAHPSRTFNTLTVRATASQHQLVKELIKKYDVPAKDLEFQFYLLKATPSGSGLKNGVPDHVLEVVEEVSALTKYKSFELMDTPVLRGSEGRSRPDRPGPQAELSGEGPIAYVINIHDLSVIETEAGYRIRVGHLSISYRLLAGYQSGSMIWEPSEVEKELKESKQQPVLKPLYRRAGVETSFTIGDGETIVLGASRLESSTESDNLAMITVITARIL